MNNAPLRSRRLLPAAAFAALLLILALTVSAEATDPTVEINVPTVTGWVWNETTAAQVPYGEALEVDLSDSVMLTGPLTWSSDEIEACGAALRADGILSVPVSCAAGDYSVTADNGTQAQRLTVRLIRAPSYCWGALINSSSATLQAPEPGEAAKNLQYTVTVFDQYGGVVDPEAYAVTWFLQTPGDDQTEFTQKNGVSIDQNGLLRVRPGARGGAFRICIRLDCWESKSARNGITVLPAQNTGVECSVEAAANSPISGTCMFFQAGTNTAREITVHLELCNSGAAAANTGVILSGYTKDGRLTGLAYETLSVPANGSAAQTLALDSAGCGKVCVFVVDGDFHPLTQKAEVRTDPFDPRAWFNVDENGTLKLQTNIDCSAWDGFGLVVDFQLSDGGHLYDSQYGYRKGMVYYDCTSLLSSQEDGAEIVGTKLTVFTSADAWSEFWSIFHDDWDEALSAMEASIAATVQVDTNISVEYSTSALELLSFSISTDDAANTETYTAKLGGPISALGEYGLLYLTSNGGRMSYIGRGDGVLTFTRDKGHFSQVSTSGDFVISHVVYSQKADGSILSTVSTSNHLPYTFG